MSKFQPITPENYQALDALLSMADRFLMHYSDEIVYPGNSTAEQQAVGILAKYGLITAVDNGYRLEHTKMLGAKAIYSYKPKEEKLTLLPPTGRYKGWGLDKYLKGQRFTKRFTPNREQSEQLAKEWYEAKLIEMENPDPSAKWDEVKKFFLEEFMPMHKYSAKSIKNYTYCFEKLNDYFHAERLSEITFKRLLEYRQFLKAEADAKDVDYNGVNKNLNMARNIFSTAVSEAFMADIGVNNLTDLPLKEEAEPTAFSEEDLSVFYKYSNDYWRFGLLYVVDGALRPGEAINTLTENADFENRIGWLCALKADPERGIAKFMPKTKFGKPADRHYLISARASEAYNKFPHKGHIYLFPDPDGKRWKDENTFNKAFKAQLKDVNEQARKDNPNHVDIVGTVKMFRKTAATHVYGNSGEEEQAQTSLGHSRKETTRKNYIDQKQKIVMEQKIKAIKESEDFIAKIDLNQKTE